MSLRDRGARFLGGLQLPGGGRPTAKREERGVKALAREEGEPPPSSPTCGLSVGLQHTQPPFPPVATCDISTAGAQRPVAGGGGIHGGRGRHADRRGGLRAGPRRPRIWPILSRGHQVCARAENVIQLTFAQPSRLPAIQSQSPSPPLSIAPWGRYGLPPFSTERLGSPRGTISRG